MEIFSSFNVVFILHSLQICLEKVMYGMFFIVMLGRTLVFGLRTNKPKTFKPQNFRKP